MKVGILPPLRHLAVDDGVHLLHVGAHCIGLEGRLHDAAVELVLVEVPHQQAAGEKVSQRRLVAHAGGKVLAGIQHQLLVEFRTQGDHEFLEGEGGLEDRAVAPEVLIQHLVGVQHKAEGIAYHRQAVAARDILQVLVVLVARVLGNREFHGGPPSGPVATG